jgi:hypothetical protein
MFREPNSNHNTGTLEQSHNFEPERQVPIHGTKTAQLSSAPAKHPNFLVINYAKTTTYITPSSSPQAQKKG